MQKVGKDGKLRNLTSGEAFVGRALRGTGIDEALGLDGRDQMRYEQNALEYLAGDDNEGVEDMLRSFKHALIAAAILVLLVFIFAK